MIKRVLFLLMALLLLCNAGLAGKQDVVDSFKTHVQKIMQPVLATYKENTTHIRYFDPARHGLPGAGHWSKVRYLEPVYSAAFVRSNIIELKALSKNFGELKVLENIDFAIERYTEIFTGEYPTKEAAAKAEKSYPSNAMQHWRFYYGYQNGTWEKTKVEFYWDTEKRFMQDKTTITEYDIFANR